MQIIWHALHFEYFFYIWYVFGLLFSVSYLVGMPHTHVIRSWPTSPNYYCSRFTRPLLMTQCLPTACTGLPPVPPREDMLLQWPQMKKKAGAIVRLGNRTEEVTNKKKLNGILSVSY